MGSPWTVTHKPSDISGIKGQETAIAELKKYIDSYKLQKKKSVLIHGTSGCGKTLVASLLAKQYGLELIELNASDERNASSIEAVLGPALKQRSLFFKGKIILIDEVDGLSGRDDRGGLGAVAKLAEDSTFPVIMTCQDPYDDKLSSIRSKALMIPFATPDHKIITEILKEICIKEGVPAEESALRTIARRCGGDIRSAITDTQTISQIHKKITEKETAGLEERWRTESVINALIKVFKNSDPQIALTAFDNVNEDLDGCIRWIDENLPKEYTDPSDLERAYESLSMSDVFKGRIMRWQYWRFLVYVNALATAGVAAAKTKRSPGFVQYSQDQRGLRIWRNNMKYQKRKGIAEKIAEGTHCSKRRAIMDTIPSLAVMVAKRPDWAQSIAEEYHLDPEEVDWLKNSVRSSPESSR